MKGCSFENYFFKSTLLLGWVVGCFPVKSPLRPKREFKVFSLISLYSWSLFLFSFVVSADFMIRTAKEFKNQPFSEFLLLYVSLFVFYAADILTRIVSFQTCRKFILISNFINGEEERTFVRKSVYSFLVMFLTVVVAIVKRAFENFVYYSDDDSFLGLVNGVVSSTPIFLCGVLVNLRGVYVFAITMSVGLQLLQYYEQFCTDFRVTCLYNNSVGMKFSGLAQFNQRFVKLQRMFDIYQDFGGDFALIILINSASDFIFFVYCFGSQVDKNISSCFGICENLLFLYCFAYLGNRLELMVFHLLLYDVIHNIFDIHKMDICVVSTLDEENENGAQKYNGRVTSKTLGKHKRNGN
jgi:hypothetical protein